MEKKIRVKRLNHHDDVKRSWAAAYPLADLEDILPEDWERAQAELDPAENSSPQIPSSDGQYSDGQYNNSDNVAK
jgi:hypothetical protein